MSSFSTSMTSSRSVVTGFCHTLYSVGMPKCEFDSPGASAGTDVPWRENTGLGAFSSSKPPRCKVAHLATLKERPTAPAPISDVAKSRIIPSGESEMTAKSSA